MIKLLVGRTDQKKTYNQDMQSEDISSVQISSWESCGK